MNGDKNKISFITATSLVIANMIGAGVFTSLGYQLGGGIQSTSALLMLWVVGGIAALCGALCYGELATTMPRSGGEYHYLSKIYHPFVGFLSGWTSALVGFSAPVAFSAAALGVYLNKVYPTADPLTTAFSVVIVITLIHTWNLKAGSGMQNVFTFLKVVLVIFFIGSGLMIDTPQNLNIQFQSNDWNDIFSSSFAVSLLYVSYAYSGWNASAYMAGEIQNPKKNIPRSLITGTCIVMGLYILLNYVFLYSAPASELKGQADVGLISALYIFGQEKGEIMGLVIALLLVSSISSMIMTGPRVTATIGEDISLLKLFSKKNRFGIPYNAIILQSVITLIIVYTQTFDAILRYIGFTLSLFTFLTVLGVFIHRIKNKNAERPYKTWGFPVTPVVFLLITGWTTVCSMIINPIESLIGIATLLVGCIIYFINQQRKTSTHLSQ